MFGAVLRLLGPVETSYMKILEPPLLGAVLRLLGAVETSYTGLSESPGLTGAFYREFSKLTALSDFRLSPCTLAYTVLAVW